MPKITPADHSILTSSGYLPPHYAAVAGRSRVAISAAGHLTQLGVNLVTNSAHYGQRQTDPTLSAAGEFVARRRLPIFTEKPGSS